jgi:hypothetical protein
MGQNTGTSNASKKVITIAMRVARAQECQNLNSDKRRANGLQQQSPVKIKFREQKIKYSART